MVHKAARNPHCDAIQYASSMGVIPLRHLSVLDANSIPGARAYMDTTPPVVPCDHERSTEGEEAWKQFTRLTYRQVEERRAAFDKRRSSPLLTLEVREMPDSR